MFVIVEELPNGNMVKHSTHDDIGLATEARNKLINGNKIYIYLSDTAEFQRLSFTN